jgi:hypothetical protein
LFINFLTQTGFDSIEELLFVMDIAQAFDLGIIAQASDLLWDTA